MSRRKRKATPARKWQPMYRSANVAPSDETIAAWQALADQHGITMADVVRLADDNEVWANDRYRCSVRYVDDAPAFEEFAGKGREGLVHLSIHDHKRGHIHDWRHLQQIKNDVMGADREALELYPAESRLVDTANEWHLWVLPAGTWAPFGFTARAVDYGSINEHPGKGRQRPESINEHPGKGRQRPESIHVEEEE